VLSIFKKTFTGLTKTRNKLANAFSGLTGKSFLDKDDLEMLEESLLQADLGWEVVDEVVQALSRKRDKSQPWNERFLDVMMHQLSGNVEKRPFQRVILLVGINGTGKTTSSAKLAGYFSEKGDNVTLVAADTYRAAAVAQIREWSQKLKLNLISNEGTTDPAAVAFDGVNSGLSKNMDRIIVDTAGRLHTSPNLMQELEKMHRVVKKLTNEVQVFITIDANTGQNGLAQAREFNNYIPLDGVILTKMDGTARGGIAVPIMTELSLPIYFMGIGEQVDDLIPFNRESYLKGLIGISERSTA
jgi:fused signal recognition particle receptor